MASIKLDKLTLKDMIFNPEYIGLSEGLVRLPVVENIRIGKKHYPVPQTFDDFTHNICFGQRLFFNRKEDNDYGVIIRVMDCYYYPLVTSEKWDEDKALLFGKNILTCAIEEVYPVSMQLVKFVSEMVDRESKLLHHEPSKIELAAGIEKLNPFHELTALNFLRDAMKVTVPEVLLTPYNECLVRFMLEKETRDFQERYFDLLKEESKTKFKTK